MSVRTLCIFLEQSNQAACSPLAIHLQIWGDISAGYNHFVIQTHCRLIFSVAMSQLVNILTWKCIYVGSKVCSQKIFFPFEENSTDRYMYDANYILPEFCLAPWTLVSLKLPYGNRRHHAQVFAVWYVWCYCLTYKSHPKLRSKCYFGFQTICQHQVMMTNTQSWWSLFGQLLGSNVIFICMFFTSTVWPYL